MLLRLALLGGALNFAPAHADVLTFDASGLFDGGYTLGGTVRIDNTLGTVIASNITISGAPALPSPDSFTTILAAAQRDPTTLLSGQLDRYANSLKLSGEGMALDRTYSAPDYTTATVRCTSIDSPVAPYTCSDQTSNLCGSRLLVEVFL